MNNNLSSSSNWRAGAQQLERRLVGFALVSVQQYEQ
jgi:hypothetical protein